PTDIAAEEREEGAVSENVCAVLPRANQIGCIWNAGLKGDLTQERANIPGKDRLTKHDPQMPALAPAALDDSADPAQRQCFDNRVDPREDLGVFGIEPAELRVDVDARPMDVVGVHERHRADTHASLNVFKEYTPSRTATLRVAVPVQVAPDA